jgi:hypothetical protein
MVTMGGDLQPGCLADRLLTGLGQPQILMATMVMVTMGGDLQPGSLADRLLTGLGQPQINP